MPSSTTYEAGAGQPTSSEAPQPSVSVAPEPDSSWRRIADFAVLGLWVTIVGFTLQHHEKWADEAQAWLIARDLDLYTMWFKELRYEGSPGLWHTILWVAQHVFHAPYGALGVIGMACATAGVAFMLWKAPFPRPLRYMLAFSYFLVYQYAVIARPYTLLPLLAFVAAYFFRDHAHPERMTLTLALLSLLSLHGILIASGVGLGYLIDATKNWRTFGEPLRRRYVLCAGAMLVVFAFTFLVLRPTSDVDKFMKAAPQVDTLDAFTSTQQVWQPSKLAKAVSIVSGGLLDYIIPSSIFLFLTGVWCFLRRKLLPFVVPAALLVLLYVFIHGHSHHHGTLFVAVITGLWIAWPTKEENKNASVGERRATQVMMALLVCLFAVNIWDAVVSIRFEYLYPYCGAEDAAKYLQSVGADKHSIFGYTYGIAAVQAYFDHNIVRNIPTTYFHHGAPSPGAFIDFAGLQAQRPEYIVFLTGAPTPELKLFDPLLNRYGYEMVHFSDGYLFFKRALMDRQVYVVYRRKP